MTRCVVHFRLSTTYQEQNMSVWWSCTFHLIIFSHTHSLYQLLKINISVMGGKEFTVQCHKLIFTAANQPNWFCKTWEHWNACQQLVFMLNPPALWFACKLKSHFAIQISVTEQQMQHYRTGKKCKPITVVSIIHDCTVLISYQI